MRHSGKRLATVWLTRSSLDRLVTTAQAYAPNETGGVLVGYSDGLSLNLVVEHIIGPGPRAFHNRYGFTPDHEYQEQEIARLYRESGRVSTYLGDWHSHPGGGLYLSVTDRKTLRRIAMAKEARVQKPLMAVIGGANWELAIWQGEMSSYWTLSVRLKVNHCKVRLFTP